jgi:hypothetical protein
MLGKQKIKVNKLWRYPACTIYIGENLSNKYLPEGYYLFVSKNEFGYDIYDYENHYQGLLESWNEEDEIEIFFEPMDKRIEKLLTFQFEHIIQLIDENYENIEEEISKFEKYKEIKRILND